MVYVCVSKLWYVCICLQVGARPLGFTVNGCPCWVLFVVSLSCFFWLGGRLSLRLVSSSSFWDTRSTRSLVCTNIESDWQQNQPLHSALYWLLIPILLSCLVSCKLGLLSAGELLQHCSQPVYRSQPRGGPCQELQVSDRMSVFSSWTCYHPHQVKYGSLV